MIDLADRRAELAAALRAGRPLPAGRLLGLPDLPDGDVWVDIAGAAVFAGVAERTITAWLSRRGPKRNPFPAGHRILYRLYWPLSTITHWTTTQREPS